MKPLCKHCGKPAEAHHEFERAMPEGCQCDEGSWGDDVTPICKAYQGRYGLGQCAKCQHDRNCHWPYAHLSGRKGAKNEAV